MSTNTPTIDQSAAVAAVKAYALANWSVSAWDVIHECWEDADIIQAIGSITDPAAAIAAVRVIVDIHESRRSDVYSEIF